MLPIKAQRARAAVVEENPAPVEALQELALHFSQAGSPFSDRYRK